MGFVLLLFIAAVIVTTVQRLRSIGKSARYAFLLLLPVINILLILVLCLTPEKTTDKNLSFLDRFIPKSQLGSAIAGLAISIVPAIIFTYYAANVLSSYGWGLFTLIPFSVGLITSIIYGYHEQRSIGQSISLSLVSVLILSGAMLLLAFEGAICIAMAAPIGLLLTIIGAIVGKFLQRPISRRIKTSYMLVVVIITVPSFVTAEYIIDPEPPLIQVSSSVIIEAPPEEVWSNVVTFSELPEPKHWLFKTGIAYPLKAEIKGSGVGAVRECIFTTGAFVEPITTWDEPRLLQFSVISNPHPMQEWTPYKHIHPPHLDGFFVSKKGQFNLIELPGGNTELIGTTWYHHTMWPVSYWQVISDYILHQIHLRVLNHIKERSEL